VNEEAPLESSLNLTLTQYPHDKYLESRKVRPRLEVKPLQAWYYCIFLNSHTLVILLQVDLAFHDEFETVCKVVTRLKTFLSSHGLQFPTLDIIIGYVV